MSKRTRITAWSLLALLVAGSWISIGFAAKNSTPVGAVGATMALMDRRNINGQVTDNIASDGSPYVNGVNGVTCYVYLTAPFPGTGQYDMTLQLQGGPRRINYRFAPIDGSGPSGILSDSSWVNIRNIGQMTPGTTSATSAAFLTNIGSFFFLGAYSLGRNPGQYSTPVTVSRSLDGKTWTVTADPFSGEESLVCAACAPTFLPGDIAQLNSRTGGWNSYQMPFQLIITIS